MGEIEKSTMYGNRTMGPHSSLQLIAPAKRVKDQQGSILEQVRKGDKLDPCLTRLNTAMPMMTISRLFLFYWLCDIL